MIALAVINFIFSLILSRVILHDFNYFAINQSEQCSGFRNSFSFIPEDVQRFTFLYKWWTLTLRDIERSEWSLNEFAWIMIKKRYWTEQWNGIRLLVISWEPNVTQFKQSAEAKLSQTLKYRSRGWVTSASTQAALAYGLVLVNWTAQYKIDV